MFGFSKPDVQGILNWLIMKNFALKSNLSHWVFLSCSLLALSFLPSRTLAQGVLYYARTDGSVPAIDVVTGTEVAVISSSEFIGANPGGAREIAFDPETRLLWYSATDNQIYSVHVDTLDNGPSITSIPGAIIGSARHLFIDYTNRKLIVPITDGSVIFYNLSDQQQSGSIPSNFFTDGNVGAFRHFASDARTGNLWYAATDGSFREMNPVTSTHTGRVISFSEQTGANPGGGRHFVIDTVRNLLVYMVTDDSMASINLDTLQAAAFTISGTAFTGAAIGAGRIITIDSPFVKSKVSAITGNEFTLNWSSAGPGYLYRVDYRDSLETGDWAPLPGTTWPVAATSLAGIPLSQSKRFYRIVAISD